uniref:DUF2428 domain-containing protein n=1 Tax=Timema douglasi TaxID=61478 RepID=A0A7R8VME4_TIMDO|nr:unnamed protein product [Timema douglasi]
MSGSPLQPLLLPHLRPMCCQLSQEDIESTGSWYVVNLEENLIEISKKLCTNEYRHYHNTEIVSDALKLCVDLFGILAYANLPLDVLMVASTALCHALEDFPLLTKGLVWSLSCSHLVSAGTLAYRACLKDIDESDWILFFMPAIEVVVTTENDNDISLVRLGRKKGIILSLWQPEMLLDTSFDLEYLTNIALQHPSEIIRSRPCTLSGLLLCCAEWQAQLLQQDLWQAASSGAPLHGLLTALSLVAAHPTGAEISILNAAEVERLVCLMERVVAHLLSVLASKANNITNFAPSFAEMAEAIDSTFCDILSRDEEEVMDTTPAHQLVINCIWFNLKVNKISMACCSLSSELASIESTASDIAERCGLLIVRVLKQCRHKGVIESAGMSLSHLIKMMTSNKCVRACHDLPERILTEFLDVLQEGSSAASVTRRCAGLAILVHKIVASDKHKNRPLLHLCVSRLLKIATDPVRLYSSDTSDLPSTQALHFLCMLVQDSALCQNVAAYMSDITQLCFKKLSSNIWTVRNAALQLFGALVPRLVGEKKNNDENMIGVQHMEDITNPFDHGVRNIYAEETKVIDLFAQSLLTFVQSSKNSELIELKRFASVRAESYDTDIEYVLQLLGKKFDQAYVYGIFLDP